MTELPIDDSLQNGMVLLIDDEQVIRDIGCELFESVGISCITASSGEEGIDIFKERRDDIVIVVLDIELPGICGNEAFEELKRIDPDVKVLFASGYAKEYVENRFFKRRISHFMSKPFQLNQLIEKVNLLLTETS